VTFPEFFGIFDSSFIRKVNENYTAGIKIIDQTSTHLYLSNDSNIKTVKTRKKAKKTFTQWFSDL